MSKTYSAGIVTAYGAAKRAGYQGTYEDFCRQQAQYADNASAVEQAKNTAVSASQSADQAKQDALTASTTAQSASQSAQGSAQSAGQSAVDAQTAKNNAQTYAQSASQSAGSAQQSAQSAQAVLESIPEDYSDLSEDVDQLKAYLDDANESLIKTTGNELYNNFVKKHFVTTNGSTYNLSTPSTDNNFCYIVIDASGGDEFTIRGVGGASPRLWAFVDGETNGNILSKADAFATGDDLVVTAPSGTTKLIVNSRMDESPYVYKNVILEKRVSLLEGELAEKYGQLKNGIDDDFTNSSISSGYSWYRVIEDCFFKNQEVSIKNNGSEAITVTFYKSDNTRIIDNVVAPGSTWVYKIQSQVPSYMNAYRSGNSVYSMHIKVDGIPDTIEAISIETDALTGQIIFPPTLKIDLSSYDTVKLHGTDRLYTHSNAYGRRAILFSDVADNISGATFNSTTNVLTIPMSAESVLLLNPLTNVISLSTSWVIPNNNIVLLYRYYQSYGGFLFNNSFSRQFNDRVEEVLATHNPRIIDKYAEQIGNVVSGADYSRGSYNKNLTFLLVSDSHEDYEAIGNAIELSENISAIDCILHLGDSAAIPAIPISGLNPVASYISGKTLTKPFFAVMGNHDGQNNGDSSTYGTVEQGVAGFLATLNTSSMYDERGYGYYDFTDKSIRLIILNCFDYPATTTEGTYDFYDDYILWQQEQVDFFINTLKSVPSGYTVIVASHYSELANIDNTIIPQHSGSGKITGTYMVIGDKTRMSDVVMSDIINAYKQRTTLNKSYTFSNGSVTGNVSVNDSFATANGEFAIWVCGHKHRSSVSKSSVGDYWVYVHDTSCCGQSGWATAYSNQPRCRDTNTRDLITAMSIDTSNKVINFTRIGAHINRFLDDENFVHLSYATEST